MRLASTRDPLRVSTFRDALLAGLAPDGGLYQPLDDYDLRSLLEQPHRPGGQDGTDRSDGFAPLAADAAEALLADEFDNIRELTRSALTFPVPLAELEPGITVLEVFHGPSCAFKDVGASFLAATMDATLADSGKRAVVLVATSGDTGSAVGRAFVGRSQIDVVILYPSGRVSPLQEKQLTTIGANVVALEIDGAFDDCQRLVKAAFVDRGLRAAVAITSANSINIGRLIPQAFYYLHGYRQAVAAGAQRIVFSVPSGNFGNLTAGVLARRWGMRAERFVAATNINDVVPEYLAGLEFTPRRSVRTIANAMDVGNPSNFERLQAIFPTREKMREMIVGSVSTDEQMRETMRDVYERRERFIDPHTAAGVRAAREYRRDVDGSAHVVVVSTADPAKFPETVSTACGASPPVPRQLAGIESLPKRSIEMAAETEELKRFLLDRFAK